VDKFCGKKGKKKGKPVILDMTAWKGDSGKQIGGNEGLEGSKRRWITIPEISVVTMGRNHRRDKVGSDEQ